MICACHHMLHGAIHHSPRTGGICQTNGNSHMHLCIQSFDAYRLPRLRRIPAALDESLRPPAFRKPNETEVVQLRPPKLRIGPLYARKKRITENAHRRGGGEGGEMRQAVRGEGVPETVCKCPASAPNDGVLPPPPPPPSPLNTPPSTERP